MEFQAEAKLAGITCHQVPVEVHWAIGKVERYHAPLRLAFDIIRAETKNTISIDAALQMAFKAVNDTAGPDGLVPTLLVFGACPRISLDSPPTPSQKQRASAITKAMTELRKRTAERKIRDALNTRNGPNTIKMLPKSLALGSEVRVYREKKGWTGPFKVLDVTETNVTVDMENGPVLFSNTAVLPYYRYPEIHPDLNSQSTKKGEFVTPFEYPEPEQPRKRGRPPKNEKAVLPQRNPQELTREEEKKSVIEANINMSQKERTDYSLAIKLRQEGVITTPGEPFEKADANEIESLLGQGMIKPVIYNKEFSGLRVFDSRLVREVKGKNEKPYEKSRLVVQGCNDAGKMAILTQSPTIQRCSQRLILAIAQPLRKLGMQVMHRDITQAYTQSKTELNRTVLAYLPLELKEKYPECQKQHVDSGVKALRLTG